jgi:tetratricopeptide (TPR) repeat protein
MKGERRHELKHNELLDWINKVIETVKPYSKAIASVACVGAVVLALATWWMRYTRAEAAGAWDGVYAGLDSRQPAELEKLAEQYSGSDVSYWAKLAAADLYLSIGCSELFTNKASAETELEKAIDSYRIVQEGSSQPELREQATFGLARAYEAKAGCSDSLKRWRDQVEKSEKERDEAEEAYKKAVEASESGQGGTEKEELKSKLDQANRRVEEAKKEIEEFEKRVEEDVKKRLELAEEQYLAVKENWPNGAYAKLAAGRLADLQRDETEKFYYDFTQFDPQPAFSAAGPGEKSGLDPDTFLDKEEVTGFPQLEGLGGVSPGETIKVEGTQAAEEPEAVEPDAAETEAVDPDAAETEAAGEEPEDAASEPSDPMPEAETSATETEEPAAQGQKPPSGPANGGQGEPKPPEAPKTESKEAESKSSE